MALALNEDWTADVVGRMHKFRIRNSDLAERAGYDPAYVSTVLNDSKTFGSPEAKEKTKQRILTALAELEHLMDAAERKAGAGTLEARRIDLIRREFYGPLRKATDEYRSLMCDVGAERKRRAELPDERDALKGAKWRPCSKASRFDGAVFLSAPDSMMITTDTNKVTRTGHFFANATLEPSAKYRLSYFVKCDGITPVVSGGGVSAIVRQMKKGGGTKGKEWIFPEHDNFLSGTTDWIPQVFEFETDESWREHPETAIWLRTRYAAGVAHFDDVRLDRISK